MHPRNVASLVAVMLLAAGCSATKPDCKGDAVVCGGTCVELKSDNLNCGACGSSCPAGTVCSSGACALSCAAGLLDCGGHCIDPSTDRLHCGASGTCATGTAGAACADGQLCSAGTCTQTCSAAQEACPAASPTYCTDTTRDANNCGACGAACAAGQQCSGSACACPTVRPDGCGAGASAFCTDFSGDPMNCGGCGTTCAAGQACSAGVCSLVCAGGASTCGSSCVDTQQDAANCGACGTVCPAGQVCAGGTCGLTCVGGTTRCGTACVDTRNDPGNCGACATACPGGQVCSASACALSCTGGTTRCGTACVDTRNDPANCGACATACGAGKVCSSSTCVTQCPVGEYACGGKCVDPQSDPSYCGAAADCSGGVVCGVNQSCYHGLCKGVGSPTSCADQLSRGPVPSGVYTIDPDGAGGAAPFNVYCDMVTSGGGWTLVLAYKHAAGALVPLAPGTPPLDPLLGYSNFSGAQLAALPFGSLRFYCETSNHSRRIHVSFSNPSAISFVKGVGINALGDWQTFTPLAGHTGNLPLAADSVDNPGVDTRLADRPFYKGATFHWLIYASNRFECDDYVGGPSAATLHQVWAR